MTGQRKAVSREKFAKQSQGKAFRISSYRNTQICAAQIFSGSIRRKGEATAPRHFREDCANRFRMMGVLL
jgi:hypothetical protein